MQQQTRMCKCLRCRPWSFLGICPGVLQLGNTGVLLLAFGETFRLISTVLHQFTLQPGVKKGTLLPAPQQCRQLIFQDSHSGWGEAESQSSCNLHFRKVFLKCKWNCFIPNTAFFNGSQLIFRKKKPIKFIIKAHHDLA